MKNVYIRQRWVPRPIIFLLAGALAALLIYAGLDHLDRLTPDWAGLSRTIPFFAYGGFVVLVLAASATHIQVTASDISRYYSPVPYKPKLKVPLKDIEQVLFWQTNLGPFSVYGLGLQTRTGKRVLHELFRSRDDVFREVKRIADALGARGLTTVKVAETRAVVTFGTLGNPWVYAAGLAIFVVFYRLARF